MKTIRVFEAFAGYGSQSMALKRLQRDFPDKVEFEFVGISEIDAYAISAYNAVHGDTPNFGDISKVDWSQVPDFDCFTYSFPCQDISTAGKQKGFVEGSGSRSSLLWECRRAIESKRPKFLLMENVKALVQKKFMPEFQRWIDTLAELGYSNYWKVLNAKDYGVAQNRERVFMVSILGEHETYNFPTPMILKLTLCAAHVGENIHHLLLRRPVWSTHRIFVDGLCHLRYSADFKARNRFLVKNIDCLIYSC